MTNRREFVQTTAAIAESLVVPQVSVRRTHVPAGRSAQGGQREPDGVVRWHRDGVGDALGFLGAGAISDLA